MDPARWQRLERLFAAAEALPPAARAAFLDGEFAGAPDPELRAELEAMLRAGAGGEPSATLPGGLALAIGDGLEAFADDEGEDGWREPERPPTHLGPYRILREVGRGGMATVYEAARDDREFERRVAVKIISRGMASADIVRRLRRERQILANLDHPNIARLLDGGSTADGQPYVVMEFIDGEPIDAYCESRGLGLAARLELFRQVCGAVQFAHKSLVLHRDIKPSNILVTAQGVPKLLDFGIAKLVAGDRAAGDELPTAERAVEPTFEPTLTGQRLLTPEWASPEQVRGEPLTTASDVYSLGLLLYLLVAGRRAYQADRRRPGELERLVCEVLPPPPRRDPGAGVVGRAGLAPGLFAPLGDLEVVVMAALRKEPARRYASAEQLGEDVRRFLGNLPVAARKDSLGYRAGIFVRRHRWAVLLAAAAFAALLGIALVAVSQARAARAESLRAERNLQLAEAQRKQADDQRRRAEQVAALLTGIFEVSDPDEARGRTLTAREVLDQGAARLRGEAGGSLQRDPGLRAELLGTIGRIYQKLALYDEAEALLNEAAGLRRGLDPGSREMAAGLRDLAQLALDRGRFEESLQRSGEARALFAAKGPPERQEVARCLLLMADAEVQLDRLDAAESHYREALAIQERLAGPDVQRVAETRLLLGEIQYRRGAYEPARALFEQALAARRQLGADHPEVAIVLNNLAAAELALGRLPEAEQHLSEVLALRRKLFGENHDQVAGALNNLAAVLAARGEVAAALADAEKALAIYRRVLGPGHPRVADCLHNVGQLHHRLGHFAAAGEHYRQALALRRRIYGPVNPLVAQTLRNLGDLALDREPARAADLFRQALAIDRQALPEKDYRLANSLVGLGRAALWRRDYPAAESAFREAVEIRRLRLPDDPGRAEAEGWLGHARELRAPGAGGRAQLAAAVAELATRLGAEHARTRQLAKLLESPAAPTRLREGRGRGRSGNRRE